MKQKQMKLDTLIDDHQRKCRVQDRNSITELFPFLITELFPFLIFLPPTSKKLERHIASGTFVRDSVHPSVRYMF